MSERIIVAAAVGHAAAARMALAGYPGGLDEDLWASFGRPHRFQGDDGGEMAVQALAEYVCRYHEAVSGESLFIQAAAYGVHRTAADGWAELAEELKLPYQIFAVTCRETSEALGRLGYPLPPVKPAAA